jgi:hypothetical protein
VSDGVKAPVNERPVGHAQGHARHDRLLIVRYAAGDLDGPDLEQARAQAGQCADCTALAADIKSVQTSLAALPAPKRTRDFRLTPEQADELRGSAFDRFLRRLAMPKLALLRPVAGVGVALGLTIAAVGGGMPASYLSSAGAPAPAPQAADVGATQSQRDDRGTVSAPEASMEMASGDAGSEWPPSGAPAAAATDTVKATQSDGSFNLSAAPTATVAATATLAAMLLPTPTATAHALGGSPEATALPSDDNKQLAVYGGLTLAFVAFGLLLLSLYARRRNEDPLLR